ncbi:Formimidoyltransferase-cyclodeaminase-like protein, partial [Dinothrombium tinctorium]
IDAIANAIRECEGVSLLDVDPGPSTNRTVYTFVGSPDAVIEGALNAARVAYNLIDMRKHTGEHPRLGALDVCPFIPVRDVEMEECIYCARKFAEKLAAELKVPVFLYGFAAHQDYRRTVPQIRAGEYEGLKSRLTQPEWKPDFGSNTFVPNWGATMAGARKFLIAYNVNLISTKEQAHRIALNIREQGRGPNEPGRLKCVQAIGWWLNEANIAQVTINLTDYEVTAIHDAFEEVCKDAKEYNLAVTGSQIVGMVPLRAILLAADFYIKKENLFVLEEDQKVHLAINRLGLSSLGAFNPKERIIEYMLEDNKFGALAKQPVHQFVRSVADRTTAPGGGSVAANVAALGSALGAMVAKLSYGKKMFEQNEKPMRRLIPIFHHTANDLISFIDADTNAYTDYISALRLPKSTVEEEAVREAAIEAGIKNAISVPLRLAQTASKLWKPAKELASIINLSTQSDLQVGAQCLKAGILGAYYNVIINLKDTKDVEFRQKVIQFQTIVSKCSSIRYFLVVESEIENLRKEAEIGAEEIFNVLK